MTVVVQLDVLSVVAGHASDIITISNDSPERRQTLSNSVLAMIKDGFVVMLNDGRKVLGYDPVTNEWVLGPKTSSARVDASAEPATVIAPLAGG